jgi:hypothetical protein
MTVVYNRTMLARSKQPSTAKSPSNRRAATIRPVAPRPTVVLVPSLRYWRTKRALLQRELAERAGINRDTVRRAEDPDQPRAIRLDIVRKLAGALGIDPAELQANPPD